ncbi:hypothetical protein [Micromonospora carbonacea]|uniref:Uncharacterized protein n=1 Tax=Micromonospora carbonacea TaxID=47853 RepID=A0A1C5ABC3_9ACTN|nr:hypothetical protein [Micromonospora carbonacea]SCF42505.1 hypothetical protein GA0070563_11287 [Micromonospora carbonacea]
MTVRPTTSAPRRQARPDVRRRGAVYGIPTLAVDALGKPIPGTVVVGYIGQTRQTVKQREGQHRVSQPFGDLIVGGSWVIEEGFWTDAELDAKEQHYIRGGAVLVPGQAPQRPVYNIDHNRENPNRIPPWDALAHRQAREPGWQPPPKGARIPTQRGAASTVRPRPVSPLSRWWGRRRWQVVLWAAVWALLFAGSWWVGADTWSGWAEPRNAAVAATVATAGIGWRGWKTSGPKRRRSKRRGRRR